MRQLVLLAAECGLPAHAIDCLVACDIDAPCPRIGWRLGRRPAFQRNRKGLLQRVFGKIEIADEADERGQRPPRLVAEYPVDFDRRHADTLFDSCRSGGVRTTSCDVQWHIGEPRDSEFRASTRSSNGGIAI